jgi:chemotaxis signal transduction protein
MLSFRASGSTWAIPVTDVLEILQSPPLIRLPLLPESAPGIIGVRGSAVPAIDVGRLAGDAGVTRRPAILVGRGGRRIALLVDSVDDIVEGEPEDATLLDLDELLESLQAQAEPPAGQGGPA